MVAGFVCFLGVGHHLFELGPIDGPVLFAGTFLEQADDIGELAGDACSLLTVSAGVRGFAKSASAIFFSAFASRGKHGDDLDQAGECGHAWNHGGHPVLGHDEQQDSGQQ